MTYAELLQQLKLNGSRKLAAFYSGLIKTLPERFIGVRTPILRKIAKQVDVDEVLFFPDEYYEVTFIKLAAISYLPYERLTFYLQKAVSLMDNWALCDSFKPKCLCKHKLEFLPYIKTFHESGEEFSVRYALVALLSYYVEAEYLPLIFEYLRKTDCTAYYVHMSAAWLTAEILVKHFEEGVAFLKQGALNAKTHNKAIQKAIESYRLTKDQKEFLRTLKIKNV